MSASAPWHRQVARRRGSEGRAHQIWPVIQTGATVMDRLFGHGGFRCAVTQLITHRAAARVVWADRNQSLTNRTTDWPPSSIRFHRMWRRLVLRRWAQSRIGSRRAPIANLT
jgi:hypothetical protein